jgi:hypothetical protein
MTITLQIVQVSLFAIPILVLVALGWMILRLPVTVMNRRWLLMTFVPLLLANLAAIVMNDSQNAIQVLADGRFWLIAAVDVALTVGIYLWLRGYSVYGLTLTQAETACREALEAQGLDVSVRVGEKRALLVTAPQATIFTVTLADGEEELWLTARAGEVVLRADSQCGMALLKDLLPSLRAYPAEYHFKAHSMGVLYLVLAVVLLVFGWIYFFEPRLILVE